MKTWSDKKLKLGVTVPNVDKDRGDALNILNVVIEINIINKIIYT